MATLALLIGGGGSLLLWPSVALGTVGIFYAYIGPEGFGKKAGKHNIFLTLLLAPYLFIARLLPLIRNRNHPPANEVCDGIWVGRLPLWHEMKEAPFTGLLDLTAELRISPGPWQYRSLPWLDIITPTPEKLEQAVGAINELGEKGKPVLVACALGRGRSACVVAAWLIYTKRAKTVAEAVERLNQSRSLVHLRDRHKKVLEGCIKRWKNHSEHI